MGALIAALVFAHYAGNIWLGLIVASGGMAGFCLAHGDKGGVRFGVVIPSLWLTEVIKTIRPSWGIDEGPSMWFICGAIFFITGTVRLLRFLMLHRMPRA